jgi:hypothetical protein
VNGRDIIISWQTLMIFDILATETHRRSPEEYKVIALSGSRIPLRQSSSSVDKTRC